MRVVCPKCKIDIAAEQINAVTDLAVCAKCGEAYQLSEIVESESSRKFDLNEPPHGVWFEETFDGWRLGSTLRSWASLFLVPFTLVWSGGSLGGIYGTQLWQGKFNLVQSLFGIPFALGSVALVTMTLMTLLGKLVVSVRGDDGEVFTGVGPIGWRRRFLWSEVERVTQAQSTAHRNSESTPRTVIVLEGKSRIEFGSMLSIDRRLYITLSLKRFLWERRGGGK